MSDYEVFEAGLKLNLGSEQGDYWGFVSVNPETGFINAVHTGARNLEESQVFIEKIRSGSDGIAPVISSDSWFYEKSILNVYSTEKEVEYKGRGRKPNPILVPDEELGYVQVHKQRDEKGKIINISTRIVIGDEIKILTMFENASRCKTINTDYVESRNGKFRKNNARLIRRTLCHSKKVVFHNAQILFLTQVMNYTWIKQHLSLIINQNAPKFKQKYLHKTSAMQEGLVNKILTIKELLFIRPKGRAAA